MQSLKILFLGNSFAEDTMQYAAEVAQSLGVSSVTLGLLYKGGCPIDFHYSHAVKDEPEYEYRTNDGSGWTCSLDYTVNRAVNSEDWDWIAIQHGTRDDRRYTSPECYEKLAPLVDYLKSITPSKTKFAFNLTWLGEPDHPHHEILSYDKNTALMRKKLEEVTKEVIANTPQIDLLIPTGTAVENARTSAIGILTRDGYHLSLDKGRFIAALTLISTITQIPAERISWAPEGVDDYAVKVAVSAVKYAQQNPLAITKIDF
ncbi:MAG: DUF4886 domain-containing protein [Clostridia bacterium]|nr:DUF4886 domain-containing protein [Clostridia bacterium]